MLLYIHVPFCRAKCRYCAFYSEPLHNEPGLGGNLRLRDYTDALFMEMALWGDRLGRRDVSTIFFGGGTPSILPVKTLATIMERIRRTFKVASNAEITLEANPESFNNKLDAREIRLMGFNRLSLGVQSLHDPYLEMLGRPHRAAEAHAAYNLARTAGFGNVNLDFIWGLPGQKVSQWIQQMKVVRDMQPEHVSAYGLTLEPDTPLATDVHNGRYLLPEERDQTLMYMEGSALLEEKGLMQYEISNYARMGYHSRHNSGYWDGEDYLGLGPAAASTIEGRRWVNPSSLGDWGRDVNRRQVGQDAEELDTATRLRELLMLRLRTVRGLCLKDFQNLAGVDLVGANQKLFQGLHQSKFIRILHGQLRLTRKGMLVSNSILAALFEAADSIKPPYTTAPTQDALSTILTPALPVASLTKQPEPKMRAQNVLVQNKLVQHKS